MATFKPARSLEECQKILSAPGSLLELDTAIIDGRKTTVWKNLWPNLRAYWMLYGKTWSQREYVVFENERYTYGQMFEKSSKLASMLREVYGVKKGDRVAIMMRNFPEYMLCFWAACLLGAVPTLLNSLLPVKPTKYCIRLTDPKILILDPERAETLASHIPSLSARLTTFVVRDHELHPPNKSIRGIVSLQKALDKYNGPLDAWKLEPECSPEDDAALYFTSGTTGLPKGVLESQRGVLSNTFDSIYHTFRAFLRRGEAIPVPSPTDEQKVHLLGVPLFHVTGLTSLAVGITFQGTKLVLVRKWDPEQVGRLIVEEGIHAATGVPSTLLDVLDSAPIKSGKKTKLEYLGGGGAAFPSMLAPEAVRRLPGSTVTQGYGLTETNAIAVSFSGEDFVARPSSTGLPPPVTEIKIVNTETGKELPAGEIGEILIRGAKLMKGYWNDPDATRKAITKDGWFKSGDLGYVDHEGFLYIKDRAKDIIIRGGENIHSVTVENALYLDPRIMEAATVSVPDKRLGELVGAAVLLKHESRGKTTEADIIQEARKHLPPHAVPVIVYISDEPLPRNAARKFLKSDIRKIVRKAWSQRQKGGKNAGTRAKL